MAETEERVGAHGLGDKAGKALKILSYQRRKLSQVLFNSSAVFLKWPKFIANVYNTLR